MLEYKALPRKEFILFITLFLAPIKMSLHIANAWCLTEGILAFTLAKTYGLLLQWFLTRGSQQNHPGTHYTKHTHTHPYIPYYRFSCKYVWNEPRAHIFWKAFPEFQTHSSRNHYFIYTITFVLGITEEICLEFHKNSTASI